MAKPPIHGVGVGLRQPHITQILAAEPDSEIAKIPWFEVLADNYLNGGGFNQATLLAMAERYPLVLHGVGLSLGSIEPIDLDYLKNIQALKRKTRAHWYSEHLSFSSSSGLWTPDLLPLPKTAAMVDHLVKRIIKVQSFLGERILVENISAYLSYPQDEMDEATFISTVVKEADCYLLFDLNNAYVNSVNFGFNLEHYLTQLPLKQIKQVHLAGYQALPELLLDAHNHPVSQPVWFWYQRLLQLAGPLPTLIEWDDQLPSLNELLKEQQKAQLFFNRSENSTAPLLEVTE